jgi:hypothetical protein
MTVGPSTTSISLRASSGAATADSDVSSSTSSGKKRSSASVSTSPAGLSSLLYHAKAFPGSRKYMEPVCSLQSSDKRRRYLRRGSKASNMLRIPLTVSAVQSLEEWDRYQDSLLEEGSSELSMATSATTTSSMRSNNSADGSSSSISTSKSSTTTRKSRTKDSYSRSVELVALALHEAGFMDAVTLHTAPTSERRADLPGKAIKESDHIVMDTLDDFSKSTLMNSCSSSTSGKSASGTMPSTRHDHHQSPPHPPRWLDQSQRAQSQQQGLPLGSQHHAAPPATVELLASALALSSIHDATVESDSLHNHG